MSDKAQSAYITEDPSPALCVVAADGAFHKFPISTVTLARLASECARAVWGDLIQVARAKR